MQDSAAAAARRELDRCVAGGGLPGIQYTVADAADLRFQYCGGSRDLRACSPVVIDTTFMASSSTKVYTAAAILQLAQAGKLSLEDPLSLHYAEHPYGDQLTVRQLLAHTSGIPNPIPLRWLHPAAEHARFDEAAALQEVLRRHHSLRHRPGHAHAYSNIGYWLLGRVVEVVSGTEFTAYLRAHVLDPLGIPAHDAAFCIPDPNRHATGYQPKYTPLGVLLWLLMDRRLLGETVDGYCSLRAVCMNGAAYGGLICTATALSRLAQDLLRPRPRLMDDGMRQQFFSPQHTSAGAATGASLGWRIGQLSGQLYYGKPGGGPGYRSNLRIYPARGIVVAWLANETAVDERAINRLSDAVDLHWLN